MKTIAIAALLGYTNASLLHRIKNHLKHEAERFQHFMGDVKEFKEHRHHKEEDDGLMTEADYKFMEHINKFGLTYGTREEFEFRSELFKQNLAEVEAINADPTMTHKVAVNKFSTWTPAEKKTLTGYK